MTKTNWLGGALLLCLVAVPGYSTTLLSFGGTITGIIKVTGSGTTSALANSGACTGNNYFCLGGYNSLTVSGAPSNNATFALTNTALNYDAVAKTLTLLGAISS